MEKAEERTRTNSEVTIEDILTSRLKDKAARAEQTLRTNLNGTVLVEVGEGGKRYLFDWKSDQIQVAETAERTADCKVLLSPNDLKRVARGELNPQIAILSGKVKVEGQLALGIYFFNLIAPAA